MRQYTEAHAILNAARDGQPVSIEAITQALRETGDIGHGSFGRETPHTSTEPRDDTDEQA